jgi:hypothetical protein
MGLLAGIQPMEAMMMAPGEIADQFELWCRAHRTKEAE